MISAMWKFQPLLQSLKSDSVLISTSHDAARRHAADGLQRAARLQCAQIPDELPGAVFPGTLKRKIPAGCAGHAECADARASQVRIQGANGVIGNHIERARYRKCGERRAA